ncbi:MULTISPECIES: sugar phosphate isomerase/epimerase [unclassified Cryobacterium]|uniref:sugar phosphate isomerase/epimerase family protein n=1 Tax=unclassified Cryobacterium TaxID=2649013 RepID=UPI001446638B|nr:MULTISPECIES: sugar phosphate isomerase/epimerase family protein [unclassified Cryobacterium]
MRRSLGVNTWVWVSPLDDERLERIATVAASLGFDAIELPVESVGDWDPGRARDLLGGLRLEPFVVGAMGSGRDLVDESPGVIENTQDYLRQCIDIAAAVGAGVVAGPFYARTGRTWRMTPAERARTIDRLRESLRPVVDHAATHGVVIGIEPLNRYETSLINTVEQGLDALDPLLGDHLGLALDSYHLNIEEKRITDAVRAASGHIAHVQVSGNDRGAVGDDHIDWPSFLDALDDAGYAGPLNLESFTGDNETIATAASIWRPLARSQDELAERSLRYLRQLQDERTRQ